MALNRWLARKSFHSLSLLWGEVSVSSRRVGRWMGTMLLSVVRASQYLAGWEAEALGAPGICQPSGEAVPLVIHLRPPANSGIQPSCCSALLITSLSVLALWSQRWGLGGLQDILGVEVPGGRAWGKPTDQPRAPTLPSIPFLEISMWLTYCRRSRVVCMCLPR